MAAEHAELLWDLIKPWMPDGAAALVTRRRYEENHSRIVRAHKGVARDRVLRGLLRADCDIVLRRWLTTPTPSRRLVRRGRVYASERDWLLDYARASAAHRCASLLQELGTSDGKGSKPRGGRQNRWKSWI